MPGRTKTDTGAVRSRIDDELLQLRSWGADTVYSLTTEDCTIGTDETCTIRLFDPKEVVSRKHCLISFERNKWTIRDLDSKNGMFIDGAPRFACVLESGVEIRLGSAIFVAQSPRLIALRRFLARLIGWGA